MPADRYLTTNPSGPGFIQVAGATTGGVPDADKIPALDAGGKFPVTMLPSAIGDDVIAIEALTGIGYLQRTGVNTWALSAGTGGTAADIAVTDSTDATSFIAMFDAATGNMTPRTDAGITYNSTTGTLLLDKLALDASTSTTVPLNLGMGTVNVGSGSLVNGDVWITVAGMYARINGQTFRFVDPLALPYGTFNTSQFKLTDNVFQKDAVFSTALIDDVTQRVFSLPNTNGVLATQAYVDNLVIGLLEDKGPIDCSTNPNYPAGLKGDAYRVTVPGKIGGASGVLVDTGDVFIASADNAGGTEASVGSSWYSLEHNSVSSASTVVNSTDATSFLAMFDDATGSLVAKTNSGIQYNSVIHQLKLTGVDGDQTPVLTTDRAATGTFAGNLIENKPLFKTNVLGGGPSFHQWQGTYQDGVGGNYNETMTWAYNVDCNGLVRTQRAGIGWTLEAGWDPDQDGTNPWVEYHQKYWKPTTGTEVRIASYRINPAANEIVFFHTCDNFSLYDNNHSDQEYFTAGHDVAGLGQIAIRGDGGAFIRMRGVTANTYQIGSTHGNPYTSAQRLEINAWGLVLLPGITITDNGTTKTAEWALSHLSMATDDASTIGNYTARVKRIATAAVNANKALLGPQNDWGDGPAQYNCQIRSTGTSNTAPVFVVEAIASGGFVNIKENGATYIGHIARTNTTAQVAILELASTTGGFILPRMTTTQRNLTSPVVGEAIYNTTTNRYNSYQSSAWVVAVMADDSTGNVAITGTVTASNLSGTNTGDQSLAAYATTAYVDNAVIGLLDGKGAFDCSTNPDYPAALNGDAYHVTVAGKIGGASGVSVDIGDVFVASANNAGGTQAAVGSSWYVLEHNLVGAVLTGGALATPASGTLTNCTGLPAAGVVGLGSLATQSGTFSGTSSGTNTGDQDLTAAKKRSYGVVFDGGGSTPTPGTKRFTRVPVTGTVTKATIIGDVSGSAVVDVRTSTFSSYPTTGSIAASAKPTLSSAQKAEDATLTGWTTTITAGDMLEFVLDSVTTCTTVTVLIELAVT